MKDPEGAAKPGTPRVPAWLEKLGYQRLEDLLFHFPRRHEDRARWMDPWQVQIGEPVTCLGRIVQAKQARWGGGRGAFTIILQVPGRFEALEVVWYNFPFLNKSLTVGKDLIVHGKIQEGKKGTRKLVHPEFELVKPGEDEQIHLNRITPIYPLREGVSQKILRRTVFRLIDSFTEAMPELLAEPPAGYMPRSEALGAIHFPESFEQLQQARRRVVFDELLTVQVAMGRRRSRLQRIKKARPALRAGLIDAFAKALPFAPTGAQERACREIEADLARPFPMNRLLQGDVGSGKTMVAARAMLRTLEQGKNAALMAPTETLAGQHHALFKQWLEPLGIEVVLRTGSRKETSGALFAKGGTVFIGTHALISDASFLEGIGLGVIDEQHKFGVMQRAALREKGKALDLLVMSATPIPRTLCLAIYGDLDISVLDEMPPGRTPVKTVVRKREELDRVWNFVRDELKAGRQAFVVYPAVEESEGSELKAVEKELATLQGLFGAEQVGLLHGRLKPAQKAKVMEQFRKGEFGVLASTTVIEVGVDIPNATVMVIENSERFGLAQLHQLRGRVGRGTQKSYCVLVPGDTAPPESIARIRLLERTENGFELAEADFKLRGPGNILGTEQSGLPPFALAELGGDPTLLRDARELAATLLKADPELKKHPELARVVARFEHVEKAESLD